MKTSIFALPNPKMGFFEEIDYAAKIGVDAVEPYPVAELATPDVGAAREIAAYAKEKGVAISCFSMGVDLAAENADEAVSLLVRYADVAAALGSPLLHHTLAPGLGRDFAPATLNALIRRVAPRARYVFDCARDRGLLCAYENQGFQFNGCQRFEAVLNAIDRPAGVVADFGNILFVGEKIEAFAGRFAPWIRHVHAKDYLFKAGGADYPGPEWYETLSGDYLCGTVIGYGAVAFEKTLSILRKAGYDGYFSLEYDGLGDGFVAAERSFRNLRQYGQLVSARMAAR